MNATRHQRETPDSNEGLEGKLDLKNSFSFCLAMGILNSDTNQGRPFNLSDMSGKISVKPGELPFLRVLWF